MFYGTKQLFFIEFNKIAKHFHVPVCSIEA